MAKLVLDMEPDIIDGLKKSANEKHVSVSALVENLYRNVSKETNEASFPIRKKPHEFSDWLQQIVLSKEPTTDFDHKLEYGKHLEEKYGL